MTKEELMHRAIELSKNSVKTGGGPFGAVIAKDGIIIAEASNSVTIDLDPTAHAEVNCIRQATRKLKTFNLEGCEIYTSCEPCPMCLGAIYWAHLDRIYYANDRKDAAKIGFDDEFIYEEIDRKIEDRHKPMIALREPQVAQQVEHDGGAVLARLRERQAGHGAHLQLELRHVAGVLAVVAAVVRARGDFVDHQAAVLQREELHAQHAHVLQAVCYRNRSFHRLSGKG
jgi:tRNA(Arg) A34 adenosine deaminase TadA